MFFGRNDAKAETPILWPPHAKSGLFGKDWCWEGLGAGGEEDDRGWDGWMASLTRWTWVWVNSGSWWWTGRPGVLRFIGSQSQTWLSNWTELTGFCCFLSNYFHASPQHLSHTSSAHFSIIPWNLQFYIRVCVYLWSFMWFYIEAKITFPPFPIIKKWEINALYWMLGAGALGWPRGMVRGGRRGGGSEWGTHVYLWRIHVDVWQNKYNIVK